MISNIALADVLARGVVLEPREAVAILQQLIDGGAAGGPLIEPLGPPSVENVRLGADGSAACVGLAATPAVSDLGALLQALLPGRIPGALRYTIARALLDVDARPFDSTAEMSAALSRFEIGDRFDAVRGILRRLDTATQPSPPPAIVERRRAASAHVELRRRLREADEELFLARQTSRLAPLPPAPSPGRWAAVALIAAALSFAAGYAAVSRLRGVTRPVAAAIAAPAAAAAPTLESRAYRSELAAVPDVHPTSELGAALDTHPTEALIVPVAAAPAYSPAFASTGSALFFHTGRRGDPQSGLASTPLDRDFEVMTIVDDGSRNYHVQPSPDGKAVAFDSDRDGERGVYIANRDGTGVRRISGRGFAAVPTWSPDGGRLAYIRGEADRPQVWNLWLTSLATGGQRRLTDFRYGQTWSASWFPDGTRVAYSHEDRLMILDLDSGTQRLFASPVAKRLVRTPAVSPDGRHIIFQVSRHGAWVMNVADGSMRCVLTDPTAEEFAWAPDGRRVAFHSRRDGQWGIWLMAADQT